MFRHHVRPYGEIGRTISKFGRTMSDDRLLFPALQLLTRCLKIFVIRIVASLQDRRWASEDAMKRVS